ncbi:restriction endonuclease subunit S (plasmid) [Klebsiella quasipneumoniae]|uniref:Specificity subunit S n=2 Tax=Klebsiella pneumoniae complex TaxID=3390273 RepID=A0A3G4RJC7_KLEPN|nr:MULTISPECIES: restriction endonuclease subunit S [Klebsiella]AYU65766.1 specificity subunit S [Klebsiella pneumoniae]MBC4425494.1 restriction endonuclease subunit S [Klebsiella variicola]MBK2797268.1 restriction endonuclease subunit S [Klebsiella pneumoniae]QIM13742.1 Type I restriction-modification system, specificity subunit S [Klebsiella pneumoniae]UMU52058.1 restriction endonuclease subunit S [Klebsiella quasipneumoniae]
MSELNYLEKLLDGVEVEWRTLGDTSLFEIANNGRKPVKASLRIAGETPYYGANNIQDYVDGYTHDGEYVLIAEDGSASLENYSIQYATGKFWANNHVHVVRGKERVHSRFLYHYLCIVNFLPFLTGGGRAKLTKGQLIEIPVPIPCPDNPEKSLAIQSEIVRVLDKFTALTAELTAELTARKKQYNYYRDQLLSFDEEQEKPIYLEKLLDGVEWRTLGEIAVIYDGTHQTPKYTASGVPFVSVENIKNLYGTNKYISPEDFKTYKNKPRKHDLFMTRIGDVGTCAIVEDDRPLAYYVTLALIRINQQIAVPGFIRYLIESRFGKAELYKRTLIHAVPMKINLGEIGKVAVPIPCPDNPEKSLAIQSEIVRILDKFDTLTNSITEGLPREIELRQKQYEYYRDLLFSFPKPDSVTN